MDKRVRRALNVVVLVVAMCLSGVYLDARKELEETSRRIADSEVTLKQQLEAVRWRSHHVHARYDNILTRWLYPAVLEEQKFSLITTQRSIEASLDKLTGDKYELSAVAQHAYLLHTAAVGAWAALVAAMLLF
eukprot:TRINITY_DN11908_c0_g2_i1.p1 TRINITY_DN11908_c0_g2~~TRINITY_DN11908_c0_g2_i1.p1  ORF type:complete len:133 (+),score=35.57 TRINITY_DN11908_c0_g2_i1:50-448(+)